MKTIRKLISAPKVNMGGIILDQPLPYKEIDQVDPFLLIHHWYRDYKPGGMQKEMGVGPHPHRGFAPVTFIYKGGVHHQDSRGNNSKIYEGGTQWMNSGMGIIHSERPVKELAENGGEFEIIQVWINSPTKNKMDQPSYQPITPEETPTIMSPDKLSEIQVIAGNFNDLNGKIKSNSPILILRLTIKKGGIIEIPIPDNYNSLLYQLDGSAIVCNDKTTVGKDMIWFNNDGENIKIECTENTRLLLLSGAPIDEPVTTYGPFVMNTNTEIMQAMRDYQMGKMGVLIEEFE
jgi:quercetin 2,3-dioxygenase